jgi:TonB family protein
MNVQGAVDDARNWPFLSTTITHEYRSVVVLKTNGSLPFFACLHRRKPIWLGPTPDKRDFRKLGTGQKATYRKADFSGVEAIIARTGVQPLLSLAVEEIALRTRFAKGILFALLAAGSLTLLRAQKAELDDKDTEVVEFHQLVYPPLAVTSRIEGAVIVRVKLEDHGNVTDAAALSGHELLVRAVLPNVKTWIFKPNAKKTAIVIYNFTMLRGRCEGYASLFVLQGKNVATVLTCPPNVNVTSSP